MTFEILGVSFDYLECRLPIQDWDASLWFREVCREAGADVEAFVPSAKAGYSAGLKAAQPVSGGQLSIMWGNPRCPEVAFFTATGSSAPFGIMVLEKAQDVFGHVEVNRIDCALDFRCSEDAFCGLFDRNKARLIADQMAYKVIESSTGQTLYFNWCNRPEWQKTGNEKRPLVLARLYEKGKEQGLDATWRRFEIEYRPDKPEYKKRAFNLRPDQLLGLRKWTREFCESIGYDGSQRPDRVSVYERADAVSRDIRMARCRMTQGHMVAQYRKSVREMAELLGEGGRQKVMEMLEEAFFDDGLEYAGEKPRLLAEADRDRRRAFRDDLAGSALQ